MIKRIPVLLLCFLLLSVGLSAQKPVSVIFDTDMGPDYDDVGAITLLHAYADSGKANILATIASTNYPGVAGVLNVLNTYFKRPDVKIGVPRTGARDLRDRQHWSDTLLARYPHRIKTNQDVPDATSLYRQILSQQPDKSVTIITVGFFTNLAALLRSNADEYSQYNGLELVKRKVNNLVSMAGKFPGGTEFNIEEDLRSAQYALGNWPTPVLFSGFEIGEKIKSGLPLINNESINNSPVKDVFRICIPMAKEDSAGRSSWDETAVLVGVSGFEGFYSTVPGKIVVNDDGSNGWVKGNNEHQYLVEKLPVAEVALVINRMMMHQPK